MANTPDHSAPSSPIDLSQAFSSFTDHWAPRRIATVNDYDVRIAKVEGEFVWHSHPDSDELFLVVDGDLTIKLAAERESPVQREVRLTAGQMYVVPRGVEHCPVAATETSILLFEPTGTTNTGDVGGERTREPVPLG